MFDWIVKAVAINIDLRHSYCIWGQFVVLLIVYEISSSLLPCPVAPGLVLKQFQCLVNVLLGVSEVLTVPGWAEATDICCSVNE